MVISSKTHPLGGPAPEHHRELRLELAAAGHEPVLGRQAHRDAQRLTTGDDRDLVHRVGVGQQGASYRVPGLVVGRYLLLLVGDQARLALGSGYDPVHGLFHLGHVDLVLVVPGGQQRSLVHEVGEVGAGEPWGSPGERPDLYVLPERLAPGVDAQDLLAARQVRPVDHDLPVEPSWPEERRVEDVGAVGRGEHDDAALGVEAVHLDEELVEGLLPLVVPAAEACTALPTDGVDLVHKDDARRVLLGLLEEVPDAARADSDEHLDKVRARD